MEGGPTRPGSSSRSETPEPLEWRPSRRKEEGGASDQDDAMEAAERGHIRAGRRHGKSPFSSRLLPSILQQLGSFLRYSSRKRTGGCILKATYYQFDIRYSSSSNLIDAGAPPWEGARQPPCGDSSTTPTPPPAPPFGLPPLRHSCSSSRSSDGGG